VTINGTGFTGATKVSFGGAGKATSFTVVSPTKITAVSPAGTGEHGISVTTPAGNSAAVAADNYTFT